MQPHSLVHVTWFAATYALASAGAFAVGLWNLIIANVDPEAVILTGAGGSSLLFIWWKVWTDSRATDTTVSTLKETVEELKRDCGKLQEANRKLVSEKHQLELDKAILTMRLEEDS